MALVEVNTSIGWHDFERGESALRTGKGGLQNCLRLHALVTNGSAQLAPDDAPFFRLLPNDRDSSP